MVSNDNLIRQVAWLHCEYTQKTSKISVDFDTIREGLKNDFLEGFFSPDDLKDLRNEYLSKRACES